MLQVWIGAIWWWIPIQRQGRTWLRVKKSMNTDGERKLEIGRWQEQLTALCFQRRGGKNAGKKREKTVLLAPWHPHFNLEKKWKLVLIQSCNVAEMDESHAGSCFDFQHIKINFILSVSFGRHIICKIHVCACIFSKSYSLETPMNLYESFLRRIPRVSS